MRKIRIVCEKGFYGRFRALKLEIDGREVGSIRQGKSVEIEIPPDAVEIRGRMDWGKTDSLSLTHVKEGDVITFKPYFSLNFKRGLGVKNIPIRIAHTES